MSLGALGNTARYWGFRQCMKSRRILSQVGKYAQNCLRISVYISCCCCILYIRGQWFWRPDFWLVFRIHDFFGWIRIGILGSMLLTIFVIDLQDASKKLILNTIYSGYYFLKVHLHHFSKIKSQKESQNRRNQGFFLLFLHDDRRIRSGLTSGSGSGGSGSGSGSGTLLLA